MAYNLPTQHLMKDKGRRENKDSFTVIVKSDQNDMDQVLISPFPYVQDLGQSTHVETKINGYPCIQHTFTLTIYWEQGHKLFHC